MIYTWKILEVSSEDGVILHAKYLLTGIEDETIKVETEGNWWFSDKTVKKPFDKVTESDIANWIEEESSQNNISSIKSNLENQVFNLKKIKKTSLPWKPSTFQIDI
jgi:hypothetical protein